jgi:hypothetical protein
MLSLAVTGAASYDTIVGNKSTTILILINKTVIEVLGVACWTGLQSKTMGETSKKF